MKAQRHKWSDRWIDAPKSTCTNCGLVRLQPGRAMVNIEKVSAIYYHPEKPESIRYKAGNCVKKHKPKQ